MGKRVLVVCLLYTSRAAGVFTSNVVKAAPVVWDRELIDNSPYIQAVVVNSGIANACTGRQGYAYCQETAQADVYKRQDDNMEELADLVDVIFTATPQGLCATLVNEEILSKVKIVDLSADFRIKDVKTYEEW